MTKGSIGAIAIVRQYKLYHPSGHDPLWQTVESKLWMYVYYIVAPLHHCAKIPSNSLTDHRTVEVNLAIICGCLPVLNPLFRKVPLLSSRIRSKFSGGHSGMEQASWPERLTGPRGYQVHDVEQGPAGRKAPWREPEEESSSAESCESSISMYHLQQQQQQQRQAIPSALEPAVVRKDRLGTEGEMEFKGLAM